MAGVPIPVTTRKRLSPRSPGMTTRVFHHEQCYFPGVTYKAEVNKQIQQMVHFIRQEAEEKANEVAVSTEENIVDLRLARYYLRFVLEIIAVVKYYVRVFYNVQMGIFWYTGTLLGLFALGH